MAEPIPMAGVMLVDLNGDIILQHRDDKPNIDVPGGMASFFGGRSEGNEAPLQNAIRELREETNLKITEADLEKYGEYNFISTHTHEAGATTLFIAKGINAETLEIYEGQGAHIVKNIDDPLLTPVVKPFLANWFKERDKILNATAKDKEVHRFACALFVDKNGTLFGHLRDDKPNIDSPGMIGGFGGAVEAGESSLEGAVRELEEETNLKLGPDDIEYFDRYVVWRELTQEYEQATVYLARNVDITKLKVFEGQGYETIYSLNKKISPSIIPAVKKWFEEKDA